MKRIIILCCLLNASPLAYSQSLLGKWTGYISQEINGKFEMELDVNKIMGKAYFALKSSSSTTGPFKGKAMYRVTLRTLDDNGNTFSYQDEGILDSTKQENYYWCKGSATLTLSRVKDSLVLSGDWRSPTGNCPPGVLILKKAVLEPLAAPRSLRPAPTTVSEKAIRVRGKMLTLKFWDFDAADGDSISVNLNGKVVGPAEIALPVFTLASGPTFPVELQDGENVLEVTALNEGLKPLNTIGLLVTDEEEGQKVYFSLHANQRSLLRFERR